jgi:hypothetical protein
MARILITGSAGGIGAMAAHFLVDQPHGAVLHARNDSRPAGASRTPPGAPGVMTARGTAAGDILEVRGAVPGWAVTVQARSGTDPRGAAIKVEAAQ